MKRLLTVIIAVMFMISGCSERNAWNELARKSDALYVRKLELPKDFIMGADVSSVISLEKAGVTFHDWDGQQKDIFAVLAGSGINYIRVRVWNDPFDPKGNGYGGGNCDIDTAVEIGKRATKEHMKLLVDFHYSDFWADPGKQMVPKAWKNMYVEEKAEALYQYTKDCLTKLKQEKVDVGMIQLGNETNGALCGEKKWFGICKLMIAGSKACREVFPKARIAVHFANPENGSYETYASKLDYYQLDYDVFASSYYPYWHGTLDNLISQLDNITDKYGKEVMVAETSYAYTGKDSDFFGNTISDASNVTRDYPFTVQGQANCLVNVMEAVASMKKGIGVFYWEPAWITAGGKNYEENKALWEQYGCGWAAGYARSYDPADAGRYHGGSAVDNQALFDSEGYPLESLKVFCLVHEGNELPLKADALEDCWLDFDLTEEIRLPSTVNAVMNDGSVQPVDVTWQPHDPNDPSEKIDIEGEAAGMPVICHVSRLAKNYVVNHSFEDSDLAPWKVTDNGNAEQLYVEDKVTDSLSGKQHFHFWTPVSTTLNFDLEQDVADLREGSYSYSISIMGGDGGKTNIYAYVKVNGTVVATAPMKITYYNEWHQGVIDNVKISSGDILTIGIHVEAEGSGAGAWGKIDDAVLNSK